MAEDKNQRIQNSNKLRAESKTFTVTNAGFGHVTDIILNESTDNNEITSGFIGSVKFKSPNVKNGIALPFDKNFINVPLKNEEIEIYSKITNGEEVGAYYYRRIGLSRNPNFQNASNEVYNLYRANSSGNNENASKDYSNSKQTDIANTNNTNTNETSGYGDYFQPMENIHKLKLYEGDSLIETRFGQSLRFSAYNNGEGKNRKFAPTIILRNGENEKSKKEKIEKSTEENLKEDGSILAMTSGEYELQFDGGSEYSKLETKPDSFKEYPTKLIGDQILITSGRIILSAKTAEMIFFSKKNYGFISDGNLSIDNKLGMFVKLGDEFKLTTNNQKISLLGGKGKIYLNTEAETEPIARAATLIKILEDLIEQIKLQQYLTPSGPSKIGPENVSSFDSIKSRLNNIKSTLNFTE
jgi:hypothetical protein